MRVKLTPTQIVEKWKQATSHVEGFTAAWEAYAGEWRRDYERLRTDPPSEKETKS